ncbi:p21-activated protein kinase-interacting protein 1-like [Smittium mucronatum]|uniref:p21-activated protein kinase-interacting protein 1-like n=1 Tax=Smittium mucronatum TaxID=133383 RepID=A0A1R0GVH1_9FUNG|nr:p21-activated protein kinase-interacting protein 1-like [Smittium mucronatum]
MRKSKKQRISETPEIQEKKELLLDNIDFETIKPTDSVLAVAGTYERLLYGLVIRYDSQNEKLSITPRFIMPTHINCVTSVSIGKKYLASGSADEVIKLFDLKKQKELGSLHEHSGTINKVEFFGSSHLISASTDATIMIFRTKDWEVLKVLRGHLKPINDISIHPSGKLAISVAQDYTAILWNLLTGQKAMRTKLGYEGTLVRFNTSGDSYAITDKFNNVYVIKAISKQAIIDPSGEKIDLLISISSDSKLKVWNMESVISSCLKSSEQSQDSSKTQLEPLATYDSGCRLTCLTSSVDPLSF